ncbi:MFS transporter [Phaeodactylibacter luteus]|uniref:Endo-1,3-beta-glucanase btgC n=1 Tax=Phaeodactylibacter luteus TaxID=1564516 RepID=A0A5C6RGQ3_9BACT|nr:MFS transporter [Phaeodactylibacter luteus]TXB60081.1 MFS transporter [Phaeodactylibacter luteus]
MSASSTTSKVPFGQKVAFGLGMLANQMFPAALGIFMVVLVQDLGFPGWMWSAIYFFPRIFDSITDPIMGFISDNTRSKWGRRRQYVFLGAIIMGIAFVTMWQLYREDGVEYNFYYFMLWSFVFYLGLTIFSVPYVAMGYEMSDDFHERTNIMATAQWIGQWAWVIAPWFWVIMYDPEWFPNADTATRSLAVWVGVSCAVLAMIPAIFIKSESTKEDESLAPLTIKTIGGSLMQIVDGFKQAFESVPFRKLCISTFLIFNAFNTVAAFSFFIVVYHLFNGDAAAAGIWPTLFGSLGALVTTFLVIPIVAWMSRKMGKKRAFLVSQGISVFGYVLLWFLFIPGKPYMFIFALPFFSFGIGSLFTLMMSMTADVCDLDELNTGKRREGIFGAIYWWMVKFGFAIAGGLSGLIISYVGLDPNAATQPDGAVTGLRLFFSGVPMLGTLIAMFVMRNYDLDEARAQEIQAELARRKAQKPSGQAGVELSIAGLSRQEILQKYPHFYHTAADFAAMDKTGLRQAFKEQLGRGMHGIAFSAYTEGQNPRDQITEEQIRRRLEVVRPYTSWVRTFSCTNGHELIPSIAKELGLKTMVGAWISNDLQQNEKELESLAALLEQGHVDLAAVGNEVLYRGELSEEAICGYISRVKAQAGQVPVAYVDAYYEFVNRPALTAACDVLPINCYPFWEGADIGTASLHLQEMYRMVTAVAGGKTVLVAETGWPSMGPPVGAAEPSEANYIRYFLESQMWAAQQNTGCFHFSSFDESWKIHAEGWAGTSWGIWDVNENLKFTAVDVVQNS